jgi:glycosyltransferase involved in cell wall biosynthesis
MHIALATPYDARDVRSWSGTGYNIPKALEKQGITIDYLGPLKRKYGPINVGTYLFHKYVTKRNDHPQRDRGFLEHYARQVERGIRASGGRAQALMGFGVLSLAYVRTELPMVMYTDVTWDSIIDYYPKFANLSRRTIRNGHEAEQWVLDRCNAAIFSSEWAARSAIDRYRCDPRKVRVVPFGANVPGERTQAEAEAMIDARPMDRCKLLFLGVDWGRKGGAIALELAAELNRRGLPTELTIAGCDPVCEGGVAPPFVNALGFIKKSTPEGVAKLNSLLAESHFFVLPTRADCTPIVFCEASFFGLPILTTSTGGVPSLVADGVNGRTFPLDADARPYADYVMSLMKDRAAYRRVALASFNEYRSRLNWDAAGRSVKRILESVTGGGAAVARERRSA